VLVLIPGAPQSAVSSDFEPPYDEIDYPYTDLNDYPLKVITYELIDIFENGGLWSRRNDDNIFNDLSEDERGFMNQKFLGDEYGENKATAPWGGAQGVNPLYFLNEEFASFDCDCTEDEKCEEVTIHDCQYLYNEYFCDLYQIETPQNFDYENAWVENPHDDNGNLIAVFTLSTFDGYIGSPESMQWNYTFPMGKTVNCLMGCNPSGNRLMLEFVNTSEEDILSNPGDYTISVNADFVECGPVEITQSLSDVIDGFVITDGDCTKMVYQVPDDHHIDGNQYQWDFPLYDNLKSVSTDGRRVEFNTQSVKQQTSPTTNPQNEMNYALTVSNASFPTDVEVTGKQKIPDCNFDGGLGLKIYPNPAQSSVSLDVVNLGLSEALTIHVFNHQFNKVATHTYSVDQSLIDVSKLGNGLYFLCATTKDGKMLTEKFCIDRH
jgi:hypothetical protein